MFWIRSLKLTFWNDHFEISQKLLKTWRSLNSVEVHCRQNYCGNSANTALWIQQTPMIRKVKGQRERRENFPRCKSLVICLCTISLKVWWSREVWERPDKTLCLLIYYTWLKRCHPVLTLSLLLDCQYVWIHQLLD